MSWRGTVLLKHIGELHECLDDVERQLSRKDRPRDPVAFQALTNMRARGSGRGRGAAATGNRHVRKAAREAGVNLK